MNICLQFMILGGMFLGMGALVAMYDAAEDVNLQGFLKWTMRAVYVCLFVLSMLSFAGAIAAVRS